TRIEARDGRIAGAKTFHYLVMPDSVGSFQMPAVRYPYYDLAAGAGAVATLAPRPLIVAAGLEPHAARALPPLEHRRGPVWTDELAHDLVPWGWLVLFVGPPLLAWLWTRRRPAEPIRVAAPAAAQAVSAEALYEAGALRAAADSFAARAAAEPRAPAHWYNLGATLYRAGADGKAAAAWAIASRLAPRDEAVRRARELLPP